MNIGLWIIIIIGGAAGAFSSLYIVFSLIGTIGYKIYRKTKYHISLYDYYWGETYSPLIKNYEEIAHYREGKPDTH